MKTNQVVMLLLGTLVVAVPFDSPKDYTITIKDRRQIDALGEGDQAGILDGIPTIDGLGDIGETDLSALNVDNDQSFTAAAQDDNGDGKKANQEIEDVDEQDDTGDPQTETREISPLDQADQIDITDGQSVLDAVNANITADGSNLTSTTTNNSTIVQDESSSPSTESVGIGTTVPGTAVVTEGELPSSANAQEPQEDEPEDETETGQSEFADNQDAEDDDEDVDESDTVASNSIASFPTFGNV